MAKKGKQNKKKKLREMKIKKKWTSVGLYSAFNSLQRFRCFTVERLCVR